MIDQDGGVRSQSSESQSSEGGQESDQRWPACVTQMTTERVS